VKGSEGALFRLEKSRTPEQDSLRRAFTVWIKRVLLPGRLPGVHLPEVGSLLEIKTMLAESVIEWTQDWKQQGLQEGLQQGKVALLERMLSKRFGPLNESTRSRLNNATLLQLEDWAERLLDAPTLKDVFEED
jgi:hypothetical protein